MFLVVICIKLCSYLCSVWAANTPYDRLVRVDGPSTRELGRLDIVQLKS